jgi:aminoglycoside phosphotransferase (APT) family kinase protein
MNAPLTEDVARVLRDAFGGTPIEDLSTITGGRSGSTILSFHSAGEAFVLRRPDPARPMHEARVVREIECMTIASDRGVSPTLRHADPITGIAIHAKIDGAPFRRTRALEVGGVEHLAATLRTLHEGPAFAKGLTVGAVVELFDGTLRARGTALPESLVGIIADVTKATERFAETAPCHNDLNPGNILLTNDRVYLVDWEMACAGDPYLDLGELGVFALSTPEARAELLEAYVGRTPSELERARMMLGYVTALAFFSAGFAIGGLAMGKLPNFSVDPRPVPEVLARLGAARAGAGEAEAELLDVVSVSLLRETQREVETAAYPVRQGRGQSRLTVKLGGR